ncbi:MAG: DUF3048 domain-containing protein [Actinobacteria bacterium]|nr:DUF3048 domain-containing protein [Actinomycetota bacterium]
MTGRAEAAPARVFAVKIDNGKLARPYQRGLQQAAVVYQELAEGGSTRFAAVYDSATTTEIGPVRSVRESDFELLRPYGRIAVAFSGANPGVRRGFQRQVQAGRAIDASYDAVPGIYRLAERRADARNFFTTPAKVVAARPGTARARDVGLRFGPLPATAAAPGRAGSIRFSKFSLVTVQYVPSIGGYQVRQDGRLMRDVAPANVVVQRVRTRLTGFRDVLGLYTPYTETTGSGAVTVLRDGKRLTGTWRRPAAAAGTRLVAASGADIPLRAGATWVLLVPVGQPVTFS